MNKSKKIVSFIVVLIIIGLVGYNYVYKSHRDIESEKPEFTLQSQDIINEFTVDIDVATMKYLNRTIAIKGKVSDTDDVVILIDNRIACYMSDSINYDSKLNTSIIIKGRFIGYDELLEELKLDQCSIVNN